MEWRIYALPSGIFPQGLSFCVFCGVALDVSLDYLAGKTDSPLEHRVRKELENSGLTKEQEDAIVELALNSIPIIKKHI